jgi:hypothetical protein
MKLNNANRFHIMFNDSVLQEPYEVCPIEGDPNLFCLALKTRVFVDGAMWQAFLMVDNDGVWVRCEGSVPGQSVMPSVHVVKFRNCASDADTIQQLILSLWKSVHSEYPTRIPEQVASALAGEISYAFTHYRARA